MTLEDDDESAVKSVENVDPPEVPGTVEERSGYIVDNSGNWVGPEVDKRGPTIGATKDEKHQEHVQHMQRNVLYGIGVLVVLVFLTIVIAVSFKLLTEAFAGTLLQSVMAPILAAAAVVVGYFFGQQQK